MKKLVIGLVVLLAIATVTIVGLAYADVEAREYAELEAEKRLAPAIPMASSADVEIDAFPFIGRVLLDGTVKRLDVELTDVKSRGIVVERVSLGVDGLELDRDKLLDEKKLAITGLQQARIEGTITSDAIDKVTPVTTRIRAGKIVVEYKGAEFSGAIRVKGRDVVIGVPGIKSIKFPLPDKQFLPCDPELSLEGERLILACTVHEIPAALAEVLGRGVG